jgi:hypothetical protein
MFGPEIDLLVPVRRLYTASAGVWKRALASIQRAAEQGKQVK